MTLNFFYSEKNFLGEEAVVPYILQFVPLIFLFRISRLYTDRLAFIYNDSCNVSLLSISCLAFFPLTNLFLLNRCFKNLENFSHMPKAFRRNWGMILGLLTLIPFQLGFFYFTHNYPHLLHISRVINPPTIHYFNSVSSEAGWAFSIKERIEKEKLVFLDEYKKHYEIVTMTTTGHILGTAVMATDIFSRKNRSNSKTASIDYALELFESAKYMNNLLQTQPQLIFRFSPLLIFSPVELSEAVFLNMMENRISKTYDKAITNKMNGILNVTLENGIRKNILSPENQARIEELQSPK